MSQDLLSEFDSFYQPPKPPAIQDPTQRSPSSRSNPPPRPFPRAHHTASHPSGYGHRHSPSATTFDDLLGIMDTGLVFTKPSARPLSSPQQQERRRPVSLQSSKSFGSKKSPRNSSGLVELPPQRGTSTSELYSIDGFDDFGSFQTTSPALRLPSRSHSHSQSLFDDFGLTSPPKLQMNRNPHRTPPVRTDDDFGDFVTTPFKTPEPPQPFKPPPIRPTPLPPSTSPNEMGLLLDAFGPTPYRTPEPISFQFPPRTATSHPAAPPHTGILLKAFTPAPKPPPSSPAEKFPPVAELLQTITPLFLLPQKHLLDELKGLSFPLRQKVLAHPKTKEFLEGVCEIGRVSGRIIVGRRRRVRSLLNPSPLGKGRGRGGMRLGAGTSSEIQREDREVKETLRIWGEGIGRLKAAMGEAVPELEEEWKGILKEGNGNPCKLCKLRRGDLVPGLREKTERPRWWDQGWGGHKSCRSFWENHGKDMKVLRY